MGALTSILDKKPMREKTASKRYLKNIAKSSTSLNSLESNDNVEVRKESRPQSMADSIVSCHYQFSEIFYVQFIAVGNENQRIGRVRI